MNYAVVTRVPAPLNEDGDMPHGNIAFNGDVYLDAQAIGGSHDDPYRSAGDALARPILDLYLHTPVFRLGEILVLNSSDRDQFGRKPSKWDIDIRYVDTIEEAAAVVQEVTGRG